MPKQQKWIPYVDIYPKSKVTTRKGWFGKKRSKTVTANEPAFRFEAFDMGDARRVKGLVERVHKQKAVITRQLSDEHTMSMPMRLSGRTDLDPMVNDKQLRKNMRNAMPATELTFSARIKSLKLSQDQAQVIADALKEPKEQPTE